MGVQNKSASKIFCVEKLSKFTIISSKTKKHVD